MPQHGLEQLSSDVAAAKIGVDAESLDPAARLLDAELAGPDVAQHESDHPAAHLGHLGGVGVAAQVIAHAALPDLRAVDAGDPLVDSGDAADVELVHRTHSDRRLYVGH